MATCVLSNAVVLSSPCKFSSSSFFSSSCCPISAKPLHSPSFARPLIACAAGNGNGSQAGEAIETQQSRDASLEQSRRPQLESPLLLLDSWDPFSRGGLRQMMDTMDRLFLDDWMPVRNGGVRGVNRSRPSVRTPWDVLEDEEAFYIRVDMPGFNKEDVKVSVEDGVLVVTGQRDPEKEDSRWASKSYTKFNTRLTLPENAQLDNIKAELKNGVLFVTVPKIKLEDKKQVVNVEIV